MNSTNPSQIEDEITAQAAESTTQQPVAPTTSPSSVVVEASVVPAKSRRVFRRPTAAVTAPTPEKPKRGRPAKVKPIKVEKPKRGRLAKATKAPKASKKHVGRKPKEPGDRFTNTILLRLNDEDYAKLQSVSKRQGLALAACTRMVVGKGLATFRIRK